MSGLFDFNDLTDLPVELQSKLATGGRVNPNIVIYANIVQAASAAELPVMSGRMIAAVAFRMGLTALSDNALRSALNGAVKAGLIRKVSRQTYGVIETADKPVIATEVQENPPSENEAMPVDPLA